MRGAMKNKLILFSLCSVLLVSTGGCKAKHCAAMDPTFEGANKKTGKRKKGRQEGLFDKGWRKM
jgi:hypothetical protein